MTWWGHSFATVELPGATVVTDPLMGRLKVIEVVPGDRLTVAGVDVEVLPARHDGRRDKRPGAAVAPALGFRFGSGGATCWYPGDTGPMDFAPVPEVDLALVPIGGWGPTLCDGHLDPAQSVEAVRAVGARWIVPVHFGTYWPVVLSSSGSTHHLRFVQPGPTFRAAADEAGLGDRVVIPPMGVRTTRPRGTMPL